MGTISLQQPVVGQPNSTEDPKIASDFAAIQTWANGNVDDSNLANPNNAVRRLLLSSTGSVAGPGSGVSVGAGDYLLASGGSFSNGGSVSATQPSPSIWAGDAGFSGQPVDFQVAGKSAYCRVKCMVATNAVGPACLLTGRLYSITGLGGTGGSISLTFSPLTGSSTPSFTPGTAVVSVVESGQFTMPLSGPFALGVVLNVAPAAGCVMAVTMQLYGYNA